MLSNAFTFPNLLTLARLILSPLLLPILCVHILPLNSLEANLVLAAVFLVLSMTDFFDGYLARRYKQETLVGRLLDPIADKFLLFSSLIALVYIRRIYFYWALILVGREFFIMGLRELALSFGVTIPVSVYGKTKTLMQTVLITYLIVNPYVSMGVHAPVWNGLESLLLTCTLALSVLSAYSYYQDFRKQLRIL